jgi:RNA-directed DNA polymerase
VISPLLANLYLHLLDRIWERHGLEGKLQARVVRYCDDFVVLCRAGTHHPMEVVRHVLDRLDLKLNEDKSRIIDARRGCFDFLGFSFVQRQSRRTGKWYPHVEPSKKSVQRIKAETKRLTDRRLTPIPLPEMIGRLNRTLRGWANYFHHRNCTAALGKVKWHVEERVRTHLRKRHKLNSREQGYRRFPTARLYQDFGLYKIPTTAPWRSAHALR